MPTESPTYSPTVNPTDSPTVSPTNSPTAIPTASPTFIAPNEDIESIQEKVNEAASGILEKVSSNMTNVTVSSDEALFVTNLLFSAIVSARNATSLPHSNASYKENRSLALAETALDAAATLVEKIDRTAFANNETQLIMTNLMLNSLAIITGESETSTVPNATKSNASTSATRKLERKQRERVTRQSFKILDTMIDANVVAKNESSSDINTSSTVSEISDEVANSVGEILSTLVKINSVEDEAEVGFGERNETSDPTNSTQTPSSNIKVASKTLNILKMIALSQTSNAQPAINASNRIDGNESKPETKELTSSCITMSSAASGRNNEMALRTNGNEFHMPRTAFKAAPSGDLTLTVQAISWCQNPYPSMLDPLESTGNGSKNTVQGTIKSFVTFSLLSPSARSEVAVADLPADDEVIFFSRWNKRISDMEVMLTKRFPSGTFPLILTCNSSYGDDKIHLPFGSMFDCTKAAKAFPENAGKAVYQIDFQFEPACQFWNETSSSWSRNGCRLVNVTNYGATCACTHLTTMGTIIQTFTSKVTQVFTGCIAGDANCDLENAYIVVTLLGATTIFFLLLMLFAKRRDDGDFRHKINKILSRTMTNMGRAPEKPRPVHLLGPAKVFTKNYEAEDVVDPGIFAHRLDNDYSISAKDVMMAVLNHHKIFSLVTHYDHERTRTRRALTEFVAISATYAVSTTMLQLKIVAKELGSSTLYIVLFSASIVYIVRKATWALFLRCPSLHYSTFKKRRRTSISAQKDLENIIKLTRHFPTLAGDSRDRICRLCAVPFSSNRAVEDHILDAHINSENKRPMKVSLMEIAEVVYGTSLFLKILLRDREIRRADETYLLINILKRLRRKEVAKTLNPLAVLPVGKQDALGRKTERTAAFFRNGPRLIEKYMMEQMSWLEKKFFVAYCIEKHKKRKMYGSCFTYIVVIYCYLFIGAASAFTFLFGVQEADKELQMRWLKATVFSFVFDVFAKMPAMVLMKCLMKIIITKRLTAKTVSLKGDLAAFIRIIGHEWLMGKRKGERRMSYYVRDAWVRDFLVAQGTETRSEDIHRVTAVRVSNPRLKLPFAKARLARSLVWTAPKVATATRVYKSQHLPVAKSRRLRTNAWVRGRQDEVRFTPR